MNPSEDPQRLNRRVALGWIASATAAIPMLESLGEAAEIAPAPRGYGPDPDVVRRYSPGDLWPLTFSEERRRIVIALCDIVMPADDTSPSASSLGVHDFLDEWISSPYPGQAGDRKLILKGLDWLDAEAQRRGTSNFVTLTKSDQIALCHELAKEAKSDSRKFPGSFFLRIRDLITGGYYTTPEGMKDIGYLGNVPMAEWNGPSPEALRHLGLEAQE